ncbi:MAG TPA: hypothetical protein VGO35_00785 [Gammaproteobacteria bacterium]|jgi:hypothetical protein|nr:hypothetical protein [Gammaproteobacteria bacterium]
MRKVFHLGIGALAVVCVLAKAAGTAPAAGQDKMETLVHEYSFISCDLHKLQTTQADLVQQKAAIDATGNDLAKRQDALSQQEQAHKKTPAGPVQQKAAIDAPGGDLPKRQDALSRQDQAHDQQAAAQKQHLDPDQSECTDADHATGKSTPRHVKAIKKLSKLTMVTGGGQLPLESKQTDLDMAYAQYDQKAKDWNLQEQASITALNSAYRALNEWADQADGLITSQSFRDEVHANHAGKYCPYHELPDGTLSMEELENYADSADRCLKFIAVHAGQ